MPRLTFSPLTPERWKDIESLFGPRGACGGCWCMYWRQSQQDHNRFAGDSNKRHFKQLIARGSVPGIIAYSGSEPIGWCSVSPREEYVRLANSRVLAPVDETPVWSVTCFFIARGHRRQGVSVGLLRAAVKHVKKNRGRVVEGYPTDSATKQPDAFVWTGMASAFLAAGFEEVERRSKTRPIMRYYIAR